MAALRSATASFPIFALGKAIGGGLPLAAVAGKSEIMAHFDKAKAGEQGFVYQIGTLSGNPLSVRTALINPAKK